MATAYRAGRVPSLVVGFRHMVSLDGLGALQRLLRGSIVPVRPSIAVNAQVLLTTYAKSARPNPKRNTRRAMTAPLPRGALRSIAAETALADPRNSQEQVNDEDDELSCQYCRCAVRQLTKRAHCSELQTRSPTQNDDMSFDVWSAATKARVA
jgi:hypothetical protein